MSANKINPAFLAEIKSKITTRALWLLAANLGTIDFKQARSIAAKQIGQEAKSERKQLAKSLRPQPNDATTSGGFKDLLFDRILAMKQRTVDQDAPHEPKNAPTALKPVLYLASDNTSEPKPKPTEPAPPAAVPEPGSNLP